MAINTITSSIFLLLCLFPVCSFVCQGYALEEGKDTADTPHRYRPHIVKISSLLASNVCNPITEAPHHKKATLKVVHKHGPCSHLNQLGDQKMSASDEIKLLEQDQLRVNSIHSQLSKRSGDPGFRGPKSTKSAIPVRSGQTIGSGNYIVTVGLGTPKKQLSLVLDTGSALSWTQCEPCVRYCYAQKEPIFKPLESTSYANVSCASELCNALESTT
ncbi:aspartyl protease family protein At5g10770, partial [Morus notabilis]|uniref:aspartyl protease family protein At5g10770 n=1 Tax=Morus notabilis TaxID=981085 RepID=UPI000CED773D